MGEGSGRRLTRRIQSAISRVAHHPPACDRCGAGLAMPRRRIKVSDKAVLPTEGHASETRSAAMTSITRRMTTSQLIGRFAKPLTCVALFAAYLPAQPIFAQPSDQAPA